MAQRLMSIEHFIGIVPPRMLAYRSIISELSHSVANPTDQTLFWNGNEAR
jgi:hypothetical protein